MVKLETTGLILEFLKDYNAVKDVVNDTAVDVKPEECSNADKNTTAADADISSEPKELSQAPLFIEHSLIINIYKDMKLNHPDIHQSYPSLAFILKGSAVYIEPKPKSPPKTKEYIELMAKLRATEKELEYQRLINPSFDVEGPGILELDKPQLTPAQETKAVKEQISTIFNVLISVVSVAAAVWQWSGSSTHLDLALRTLLSLFASILILVAEVFIYLRYQSKVWDARQAEYKKKEKKTVLSTYSYSTVPEESQEDSKKESGTTDIRKSRDVVSTSVEPKSTLSLRSSRASAAEKK